MPEEENQPSDSIISSEIGEKCSICLLLYADIITPKERAIAKGPVCHFFSFSFPTALLLLLFLLLLLLLLLLYLLISFN